MSELNKCETGCPVIKVLSPDDIASLALASKVKLGIIGAGFLAKAQLPCPLKTDGGEPSTTCLDMATNLAAEYQLPPNSDPNL